MATTFNHTIKPYFTPCYRAHMLDIAGLDLWSRDVVKDSWDDIRDRCSRPSGTPGSMPAPGCPEGVWDQSTRDHFIQDFDAWKAEGFL